MKKMKDTTKDKPEQESSPFSEDDNSVLSFESPESSNVVRASYNVREIACYVTFKGNYSTPKTYIYKPFPHKLWIEFWKSSSKGAFVNSHITPNYIGVLQK